jgi:hypothetical protein
MAKRTEHGKARNARPRLKDTPKTPSKSDTGQKDKLALRSLTKDLRSWLAAQGVDEQTVVSRIGVYRALVRSHPSRGIEVCVHLSAHIRNAYLAEQRAVEARVLGLDTPAGAKALEQARGHDRTAQASSIMAYDLACRQAGIAPKTDSALVDTTDQALRAAQARAATAELFGSHVSVPVDGQPIEVPSPHRELSRGYAAGDRCRITRARRRRARAGDPHQQPPPRISCGENRGRAQACTRGVGSESTEREVPDLLRW